MSRDVEIPSQCPHCRVSLSKRHAILVGQFAYEVQPAHLSPGSGDGVHWGSAKRTTDDTRAVIADCAECGKTIATYAGVSSAGASGPKGHGDVIALLESVDAQTDLLEHENAGIIEAAHDAAEMLAAAREILWPAGDVDR